MNKSAFLELIQQVSSISDQQTEELEKVAATFPYCQTAHLLLAKSAHDKGSMLSTQRLRRASAYATNRQVLKRIIYTSPAPAPVFEEPEAEEQVVTAPVIPAITESLQKQTNIISVSEEVIYKEALEEAPAENDEVLANEEEAVATPEAVAETEPADTLDQDTSLPEEAYIAEASSLAEQQADESPQAEEEVVYFELAQLLTINSLSPSFTDLLAQKADSETAKSEIADSVQETLTETDEVEVQQPNAAPLDIDYVFSSDAEADDTFPAAPEALPEAAEIIYSFSEIEQMYAEDALGYWMASSRMGETLQLKDEVTRQRPVGFHPEMILEYSKTHVLEEKPQEQQTASLHHQSNIIDQFLKLNPRLKAMQNIKMKQEPQEDLSLRNSKIKKGIASESLANIFLNQGKVKKAIKIYEQLILKYPEKKSYFAGQIEKLQNLS